MTARVQTRRRLSASPTERCVHLRGHMMACMRGRTPALALLPVGSVVPLPFLPRGDKLLDTVCGRMEEGGEDPQNAEHIGRPEEQVVAVLPCGGAGVNIEDS